MILDLFESTSNMLMQNTLKFHSTLTMKIHTKYPKPYRCIHNLQFSFVYELKINIDCNFDSIHAHELT